jgi:hypothetical protein
MRWAGSGARMLLLPLLAIAVAALGIAPAAAATAPHVARTVRFFEAPITADRAAILHGLAAGETPAHLGLHTPTKVEASKFRQQDVDKLTQQHPVAVPTRSGAPASAVRANAGQPSNQLSVAACKAAVVASGGDFYVASRYALCQSDLETIQFLENGVAVGSATYFRTVIGTAPGSGATRDLNFMVYLDTMKTYAVFDPAMTFIPTSMVTNVSGGIPGLGGSQPDGWTLSQIVADGTVSYLTSFATNTGAGVAPDDVYSDLVVFTLSFVSGPGWICTALNCPPISSAPLAMRWDNAKYVYKKKYSATSPTSGGAVFPYVVGLQYDTGASANEAAVANHIHLACTNPSATFPVNPAKAVPGCDADHLLHRLATDTKRYDDNRDAAIAACRANWGANYSRGQTLDCDEYPFASTYEGSAQHAYEPTTPANNFSAMPVVRGQNRSAGTQLLNFLRWNRILITQTDDGFYVDVTGTTSPPPQPPAVDPATVGRINGSVVQASRIDAMTDTQLSAEMSNMVSLHQNTLVLESTADSHDFLAGGVATAAYPTAQPGYQRSTSTDVVSRLLTAADAAGVQVLVGLPTDDQWTSQWANNAAWTQTAATTATVFADELWDDYGTHPSFEGWYLPLSVDNVHFGSAAAQTNLINYYNTVTGELRDLDEDLTIATGATFDAVDTTLTGWQRSTAYAAMWQSILPQVDLDVVDVQDGVGDQHASASTMGSWFTALGNAFVAASRPAELYSGSQTYLTGPSGATTPLGVKTVVADINATKAAAYTDWSASYFGYLSPNSAFGAATNSFANAYSIWAATGTGDGGDGDAPPSTPTGVTATAIDSQTVKVSWSASTDPALPVAGYTLIRNGSTVATLIGSATSYTDQQLIGSTAYTYKVQAFDGAGNTSASGGNVTATTPATPAAGTNYARCGAASGTHGCPYTASSTADPAYPDAGGVTLTDGVLGTAALGTAWQGRDISGYSFTVDLGTTKSITQIKSDWLQLRQDSRWDSVYLPQSLTFFTSTDGVTWTQVAVANQPATSSSAQTKTYKALNLTASGRYVKVAVNAGAGWTMTDELQIYGA